MCQLFVNADSSFWKSRTKSLRIDGMSTSIRMENFFWSTLEEIAARDQMTINQLITKLYYESIDADHDLGNFTSFLRVCCGRYLSLISMGELSPSLQEDLGSVSAEEILQREHEHYDDRHELMNRIPRNTHGN